jgi:hypothetical protein
MEKTFPTMLAVCTLFLISGCRTSAPMSDPRRVSLIELLSDPKQYHGMHVSVAGFYHLDIECSALYLSRDDARHGIHENSIFVFAPKFADLPRYNNSFASFFGIVRFEPQGEGHLRLFRVALDDVHRIDLQPVDEKIPNSE